MPELGENAYLPLKVIFEALIADEELRAPIYDDTADAPESDGSIIYVTGEQTDPEGYYRFEGGSYVEIGSGSGSRPDVSDDGSLVVSEASDLNFAAGLDVTDDGDGSVTIDGSAADSHTDVSDDGTLVVSSVDDINFGSNVSVTDDGDGTVTVASSDTDTDTRTDVSDGGATVVSETTDINFGTDLSVSDDGDGSATVDSTASGGSGGYSVTNQTADYTASDRDFVMADSSAGTITISLPSGPTQGDFVGVKKVSSSGNTVSVSGNGNNINGESHNVTLTNRGDELEFIYDGTDWEVFG